MLTTLVKLYREHELNGLCALYPEKSRKEAGQALENQLPLQCGGHGHYSILYFSDFKITFSNQKKRGMFPFSLKIRLWGQSWKQKLSFEGRSVYRPSFFPGKTRITALDQMK